MKFWHALFRPREQAAKIAKAETALEKTLAANKMARAQVGTELEKVLRGIASDLSDAADKIGGGKHDRR